LTKRGGQKEAVECGDQRIVRTPMFNRASCQRAPGVTPCERKMEQALGRFDYDDLLPPRARL